MRQLSSSDGVPPNVTCSTFGTQLSGTANRFATAEHPATKYPSRQLATNKQQSMNCQPNTQQQQQAQKGERAKHVSMEYFAVSFTSALATEQAGTSDCQSLVSQFPTSKRERHLLTSRNGAGCLTNTGGGPGGHWGRTFNKRSAGMGRVFQAGCLFPTSRENIGEQNQWPAQCVGHFSLDPSFGNWNEFQRTKRNQLRCP